MFKTRMKGVIPRTVNGLYYKFLGKRSLTMSLPHGSSFGTILSFWFSCEVRFEQMPAFGLFPRNKFPHNPWIVIVIDSSCNFWFLYRNLWWWASSTWVAVRWPLVLSVGSVLVVPGEDNWRTALRVSLHPGNWSGLWWFPPLDPQVSHSADNSVNE